MFKWTQTQGHTQTHTLAHIIAHTLTNKQMHYIFLMFLENIGCRISYRLYLHVTKIFRSNQFFFYVLCPYRTQKITNFNILLLFVVVSSVFFSWKNSQSVICHPFKYARCLVNVSLCYSRRQYILCLSNSPKPLLSLVSQYLFELKYKCILCYALSENLLTVFIFCVQYPLRPFVQSHV